MNNGILSLVLQCAPLLDPQLATSLIQQESGFNPYAIGMDGKAVLKPQPASLDEALRVAGMLIARGEKFSIGLSQVHINNVRSYGLSLKEAFEPCINLQHGQTIFLDFHRAALRAGWTGADAVFATLRGYNSGKINSPISNQYATEILARLGPEYRRGPAPVLAHAASSARSAPAPTPSSTSIEDGDIFSQASSGDIQKPRTSSEAVEIFDK